METRPERVPAPKQEEFQRCEVKPTACSSLHTITSKLPVLKATNNDNNGNLERLRQQSSMLIRDCQTANQSGGNILPCVHFFENLVMMISNNKRKDR
jgi:hypothetical protein